MQRIGLSSRIAVASPHGAQFASADRDRGCSRARRSVFLTIVLTGTLIAGFLPAAAQAGSADATNVKSVYGEGLVTATGTWAGGMPYTAKLTTRVTPAQIQPGEAFTIHAKVHVEWDQGESSNCAPNDQPQDYENDAVVLGKFAPGSNVWVGSESSASIPVSFTERTNTGFRCPDTGGHGIYTGEVDISIDEEHALGQGCWQTTPLTNLHIWFPTGNTPGTTQIDSVAGTISALKVGDAGACTGPTQCADTVNNDLDGPGGAPGLVDYPSDPGCTDENDPSELGTVECDDGDDDDGDGRADWPSDDGCESATDPTEGLPECSNGMNDDFDGLVDHDGAGDPTKWDPGCHGSSDPSELASSDVECDNGVDDDGDGGIDWPADKGCDSATDRSERTCFKTELTNVSDGTGLPIRHLTSLTWCVDGGKVTLPSPVYTQSSEGFDLSNEATKAFGFFDRAPLSDWKPPSIEGEGSPVATVRTYPHGESCVNYAGLVANVPALKVIGTAAWKVLPRAVRESYVVWALGFLPGTLYGLAEDSARWVRFVYQRLLQSSGAKIAEDLLDGKLKTYCSEQEATRATVTITLRADGSHSADVSGSHPWVTWRQETGSTEVLDLKHPVSSIAPNGKTIVLTAVPGPGVLQIKATGPVAGTATAAAARVKLARATKRVKSAGIIRLALTPTKRGRKLLRRGRSVKVRIVTDFTPSGSKARQRRSTTGVFGVPGRLSLSPPALYGIDTSAHSLLLTVEGRPGDRILAEARNRRSGRAVFRTSVRVPGNGNSPRRVRLQLPGEQPFFALRTRRRGITSTPIVFPTPPPALPGAP